MSKDDIKKTFKVPANHEPLVVLMGATDQKNFNNVWQDHGIDTDTMDETASKRGMEFSPVAIVINQGTGHIDATMHLLLQGWSGSVRVESSVLASKNIQRITDWLAGFMELFCMNESITGMDVASGSVVFGDSNLNIEQLVKSSTPKKDKSELLAGDMNIGSADEILGQVPQMVETVTLQVKEDPVKEENPTEVAARRTQQDIMDKYGFAALQELLKASKQPLLVDKPKKI